MTDPSASFVMLVPPGWARLPARAEDAQELERRLREILLDELPASLPRDSAVPFREELRRRITAAIADAGEAGATAVLMPVRAVEGVASLPVSIIETEVDDDEEVEPTEIIRQLLDDAGVGSEGVHEIDGAAAARTETVLRRVTPGDDLPEVDDHRVVYTVSVPHRPGRWVVLTFSAITPIGADPRLGEAMVALFDALMTTFRWIDVPGAEPSDLETRLIQIADRVDEQLAAGAMAR